MTRRSRDNPAARTGPDEDGPSRRRETTLTGVVGVSGAIIGAVLASIVTYIGTSRTQEADFLRTERRTAYVTFAADCQDQAQVLINIEIDQIGKAKATGSDTSDYQSAISSGNKLLKDYYAVQLLAPQTTADKASVTYGASEHLYEDLLKNRFSNKKVNPKEVTKRQAQIARDLASFLAAAKADLGVKR